MILYLHLTIFAVLAYSLAIKMYKKDFGAFATISTIALVSLFLENDCNTLVVSMLIVFSIVICLLDIFKRHSKCLR